MEAALRPARIDDVPALSRMRAALCEEDGLTAFDESATRTGLVEFLRGPEWGEAWVAVERDTAVGYMLVTWTFSLEFGGSCAVVDEIYLLPRARGHGLGRQLLELAEERCRARGITALRLEVERSNALAQELYRKMGFEAHSRDVMTKWLEGPDTQT